MRTSPCFTIVVNCAQVVASGVFASLLNSKIRLWRIFSYTSRLVAPLGKSSRLSNMASFIVMALIIEVSELALDGQAAFAFFNMSDDLSVDVE